MIFGAVLFWDFLEVAAKNVQFFSSHRWIGISSLCQSELEEPECDFNLRKFNEDADLVKVSFVSVRVSFEVMQLARMLVTTRTIIFLTVRDP